MNKEETSIILARLKANQQSFVINSDVANLWEREFSTDTFKDVHQAVSRFIRGNVENYPVSIAKIRALMPYRNKDSGWITSRGYDLIDGQLHKIRYHIEHDDVIVDEEGRTYAHPDPKVHMMLVSRVKSTGTFLTQQEEAAEKQKMEMRVKK